MGRKMKKNEICNECGRNVNLGSGLFVNRVLDLDDRKTRKKNNKPFPEGDFICRECEEKLSDSRR
jgi:ribosomal protein L34E